MLKVEYERFDDASEFVRLMDSRPANSHYQGTRDSRSSGDAGWYGTGSWEETLDRARKGYPEAVEKVKASAARCTSAVFERVECQPVRPINKYVGGSPNVVRAMQGIPRDMRSMQRQQKKTAGITLVYEVSAHGGVDSQEMIDAGARMVALIRLFERAQIPVRLIVSDTGKDDNDVLACEVVIKDFHAPFNMQKIAYYLAHPSMHRRLWFSWLETTDIAKKRYYGYMCPISNRRSDYDEVRKDYADRGMSWFCFRDFQSDDDVVKAWDKIRSGK